MACRFEVGVGPLQNLRRILLALADELIAIGEDGRRPDSRDIHEDVTQAARGRRCEPWTCSKRFDKLWEAAPHRGQALRVTKGRAEGPRHRGLFGSTPSLPVLFAMGFCRFVFVRCRLQVRRCPCVAFCEGKPAGARATDRFAMRAALGRSSRCALAHFRPPCHSAPLSVRR